jgi:hypothetical protein
MATNSEPIPPTTENKTDYQLNEYFDPNGPITITTNLNQYLPVYSRLGITQILITDITKNLSHFNIIGRESNVSIDVKNTLTTWPSSWGGYLTVTGRDENTSIDVKDIILENDIPLDSSLYEIIGIEENGQVIKTFIFKPQI